MWLRPLLSMIYIFGHCNCLAVPFFIFREGLSGRSARRSAEPHAHSWNISPTIFYNNIRREELGRGRRRSAEVGLQSAGAIFFCTKRSSRLAHRRISPQARSFGDSPRKNVRNCWRNFFLRVEFRSQA